MQLKILMFVLKKANFVMVAFNIYNETVAKVKEECIGLVKNQNQEPF